MRSPCFPRDAELAPFVTTLPYLRLLALLILCLMPAIAGAFERYSFSNTEVRELPMSANGRTYTLYIGLPSTYASSPTRRYPVLYACDGYWSFPQMVSIVGGLRADEAIPECIVVGMAYAGVAPDVGLLRSWDLTPSSDYSFDPQRVKSGHAREYLSVIEHEFIPFVEAQYRVDSSYRVLSGSSFGGLFTLFAMFERPGLFNAYIVPSPSLWYDSSYIQRMEQQYSLTHRSLPVRLFMSFASDESTSISTTTPAFAAQLRRTAYTGFTLAIREIAGERHSGTCSEGYNRGLRHAFAPLAPLPSTAADPGFSSIPKLTAISTRGLVRGGENALIAGIIIQGVEPKKVLVRAVGPALAGLGVTNPLSDPKVRVVGVSGYEYAKNDNWGDLANPDEISTSGSSVGLYNFTRGSRDAALIVRLEPGSYAVVVEGVNGAEGVALVEAYEVP